jgi:hypothetical protein
MAVDSSSELVVLNSFFDAFDAGRACQFLEDGQIPFALKDFSVRLQGLNKFSEGPAIRVDVLVCSEDFEHAKSCLREKMGLFPEREIDEQAETQSTDGDEALSQAIVCDLQEDAQSAKEALSDAGIRSSINRMLDEEDGTVSYSVEVKGEDIERALIVMNRWVEQR